MAKKEERKIRVLAWCDSPAVATGFATVSRGIFGYLGSTGKYEIDLIGINDRGGYKSPEKYPYRIYPARIPVQEDSDYFGRPRLIASVLKKDPDIAPPFDIIFTLNDPFILEQQLPVFKKGSLEVLKEIRETVLGKLPPEYIYKIISYFPVDSELKENWVTKAIALADYPVMYTEYGKEMVGKIEAKIKEKTQVMDRIKVIPHGYNERVFKKVKESERQAFREKYYDKKVKPNSFLVVAVARNQLRKDIPRTMMIFKELQRRRPNAFLYIHAQESDVWGSIREYGRVFNLEYGKDYAVPASFSANMGFPIEAVNLIYNSADVVLSTTLGEGLGFYNLEGFATNRVVVAPNNTAHPELFGYDKRDNITDIDSIYQKLRGIPILSGSTTSEWATYGPTDYERKRPLVNVDDAVKKLVWVYDNRDKAQEIADRAYDWVKQYTWEKVGKSWDDLFTEVYQQLQEERKGMTSDGKTKI